HDSQVAYRILFPNFSPARVTNSLERDRRKVLPADAFPARSVEPVGRSKTGTPGERRFPAMTRLLAVGSLAALLASQAPFLRAQDSPEPRKEIVRAFTLRVNGDGHVEMTVRENGKEKTYTADSMEEFTKKYPDLAREYGIGRGGFKMWRFHE